MVVGIGLGRPEPVAPALALLGSSYAVLLVSEDPPLDARAVIVGATLLATGELAHLSISSRTRVTPEAGAIAGRVGWVGVLALLALLAGGITIALVDQVRAGGLAVEIVGVAAAFAAVGLLVAAARATRHDPS